MKKPLFSIIIPTYNEEKYLPALLDSLKKQTFKDFEIIISDSKSKDKTIEIAKKYGAKVVIGPKRGPGFGRNLGAKKAKGKWLIFLDADCVLKDKEALSKLKKILEEEKIIGGAFKIDTHDGGKKEKVFYKMSNIIMDVLYKMNSYFAPGFSTFIRRDVFEKIGGYRTDLEFNEDHDLVKRAGKLGKLRFVKEITVYNSCRRLKKVGLKETLKQYLIPTIEYLTTGKSNSIKFKSMSEIEEQKSLKVRKREN